LPGAPKILFLMGTSRCGSTVLDNILGEIDGFFTGGEIRFLWERILQGRHCGCGARFVDCPIWSGIIQEGSGEQSPEEWAERVNQSQRGSARLKHTLRLVRTSARRAASKEHLGFFLETMERLYEITARSTGARVIVDSSKRPSNGALLHLMRNVDPFIVHLVRDPRAVTYSQAQVKQNPDRQIPGKMPQTGTIESMVHWNATNTSAELVRARHGKSRSLLIRYEDFVAKPRQVVQKILNLIREPHSEPPFIEADTVELRPNHTVSGNPSRFQAGTVRIRSDERWIAGLSSRDAMMTSALGAPLILKYRYPLVPRGQRIVS
jgi:Sulfotransferase family